MNTDELIEHSEMQIARATEDRIAAMRQQQDAALRRLIDNLGRCLECNEAHVEKERVAASLATCSDCGYVLDRQRSVRAKQYAT
jgi:hemerythrin-like domain-containing protein